MKKQKRRDPKEVKSLDWTPMFAAFKEAFEWALDVATGLARDYPEEVEAVERVRVFMKARLAGRAAIVPVDDVLFTFGLIIGAIERDIGPIANAGAWFAPPLMRFPSAAELWEPAPRRRVWTFSTTHLAAA